MRKITKRAAIIGTSVVLAIGGAGAAFAAWTSTGTATATATAGHAADLTVNSVTPAGTLYPGAQRDVVLNVTNSNAYDVVVTSVTFGALQVAGGTDHAGCLSNPAVTFSGAGLVGGTVIPKGQSANVTVTNGVTMGDSDNGCQNASFTADATVSAHS